MACNGFCLHLPQCSFHRLLLLLHRTHANRRCEWMKEKEISSIFVKCQSQIECENNLMSAHTSHSNSKRTSRESFGKHFRHFLFAQILFGSINGSSEHHGDSLVNCLNTFYSFIIRLSFVRWLRCWWRQILTNTEWNYIFDRKLWI